MIPLYLFNRSRTLRRSVQKRLRLCRRPILLMDFDGTLAPIRKTPAEAHLPERAKELLRLLADQPHIILGIVTGRSLPDIRRKVGRNGMLLVANHGFEIFAHGIRWVHPWAERVRPHLNRLARLLRRHLRVIPGALVENKRYTLGIHYRAVQGKDARKVRGLVLDLLVPFRKDFRITEGKKVIEVRPNVAWSKGTAVQRVLTLLKHKGRECVIYIGDDTTDEDAFEALRETGITVVVGKKKTSSAVYWVRNPGEVLEFLSILGVMLSERTKR